MVKTLIMAGGIGERLWPVSSEKRPKQFHHFGSAKTMIEETIERMEKLTSEMLIITTREQFPLIQYYTLYSREITSYSNRPEETLHPRSPSGSTRFEDDDIMVIVPSDHIIRDEETFLRTIKTAIEYAGEHEALVTIGITPTSPNTGYGYIERSPPEQHEEVFAVRKFHEKPDYETAQQYFQSGKFYWNSGMFVWKKESSTGAFETPRSCTKRCWS